MEMKFKDSSIRHLFIAVFISVAMVVLFSFGLLVSNIAGQSENNLLFLEILGIVLFIIWFFYFLVTFLFYKTVIVTEDKITLKRRKKILWIINKQDIVECVYERLSLSNFISPNAATMLFKLKCTNKFAERKINKHFGTVNYVSLSFKNVKNMVELGYNIRIINSIYEQ